MTKLNPDYVVDSDRKRKSVILPIEDWEMILEELDELEDIRAYDQASKHKQDRIPLEQAVRELDDSYGT